MFSSTSIFRIRYIVQTCCKCKKWRALHDHVVLSPVVKQNNRSSLRFSFFFSNKPENVRVPYQTSMLQNENALYCNSPNNMITRPTEQIPLHRIPSSLMCWSLWSAPHLSSTCALDWADHWSPAWRPSAEYSRSLGRTECRSSSPSRMQRAQKNASSFFHVFHAAQLYYLS